MSVTSQGRAEPTSIDPELATVIAAELAPVFQGHLITPADAGYDEARSVWNAVVDRRPGLIAQCATTDDVVAAVSAARRHGAVVSVRGGGHAVSGKAVADGVLTVDLSPMRAVAVDVDRSLVTAEGGCLLGDVDTATAEHGLVVPAGTMSETGVAGLTLGGGVGWLSRKYGLTCDNLERLEVVLADGQVVTASEAEHPDLFWALQGGGGNFGVVTRFTFRAHRFGPMIRVGLAVYRPEDAVEMLKEYAARYRELPRSVGWHAVLKRFAPPAPFVPAELVGQRVALLMAMWLDDADDPAGIATVEELTSIGRPAHRETAVLPFAAGVQTMIDADFAAGRRAYSKELHVDELADEAIERVAAFFADMPMDGEIEFFGLGGAVRDRPRDATPFNDRGYDWWLHFALLWDDAADDADHIGRARAVAADLAPWVGPGIYVNMLNVDESDRVAEAYSPTGFERLRRVKAQYDPTNLFRVNHNIAPLPE